MTVVNTDRVLLSSTTTTASLVSDTPTLSPSVIAPLEECKFSTPQGGTALHLAAARGYLGEVMNLLENGCDSYEKDDLGNTPLLCAAENAQSNVIEYLMLVSPWHTVNLAQHTFLDIVLRIVRSSIDSKIISIIETMALTLDENSEPSRVWAVAKFFENCSCPSLDELMDMIGLKRVKMEVLKLFMMIRSDLQRPEPARVAAKQAMNFLFLGNPGSGKTTVARLLVKILTELKLRENNFIECTAQKLLQDGSTKFPALLQKAIPGVLFIDEVYQLDPAASSDGRAITNTLMDAAENNREKLSIIVAGYAKDVTEKWVQFNPGIASRFTYEIVFDDFTESELRTIFLQQVRACRWRIEPFYPPDATVPVDVALVAARRLARAANKKGFANARSVRVLVEKSMRNASARQIKEAKSACTLREGLILIDPQHSVSLTLPDVIGQPINKESPLVTKLLEMTVRKC